MLSGRINVIMRSTHSSDIVEYLVSVGFSDANVSVTGIQGTLTLGEETIDVNTPVDVTGSSASTAIGSVTAVPGVEVPVTGIELTTAVNTPLITAWSNVDPGVTNTWTEVNEGVSNTWTEVDIAA